MDVFERTDTDDGVMSSMIGQINKCAAESKKVGERSDGKDA